MEALERAGHPVVRIRVKDIWHIGQEFFRWEIATAVAGAIMTLDPFDQPALFGRCEKKYQAPGQDRIELAIEEARLLDCLTGYRYVRQISSKRRNEAGRCIRSEYIETVANQNGGQGNS